jgi:tetratricopeptide (TPR) repeat protein
MRTRTHFIIYFVCTLFLATGCARFGSRPAAEFDFSFVRQSFMQDDYARIIECADAITASDLNDAENARGLYYLAISYAQQCDFKKSRACLNMLRRKKYAVSFRPAVELSSAELYFLEGRFSAAVNEYEDFIDTYPEDDRMPVALFNLGLALQKTGEFEKARELLWNITKEYPLSFEAEYVKKTDIANIKGFVLQVAAFYDKTSALDRVEELKKEGLEASYLVLQKNGTPYFRVFSGAYATQAEAEKNRLSLIEKGYDPVIFP